MHTDMVNSSDLSFGRIEPMSWGMNRLNLGIFKGFKENLS